MKAKRRAGVALVIVGVLLLAAALLLLLHNRQESDEAGAAAQEALAAVQEAIQTGNVQPGAAPAPAPADGEPEETEPTDPAETEPVPELTVTVINGHEYVGYLEIPSLDRKLPVMKLQYMEDLQIAPCLQFGSPWTDDAVIAAHNYPSHFGPLRDMTGGETILFTDMNGASITYTVKIVQTIQPTALDTVKESPYDLVLYTCTTGGKTRVMIGCDRAE